MSRELVQKLIEMKDMLYQKEHDLALVERAKRINLPFTAPQEEDRAKAELAAAQDEKAKVQAQLHRANLFGPRYTRSLVPSLCILCFVDHGKETPMTEVPCSFGNGFRQFKCPECAYEFRVSPT